MSHPEPHDYATPPQPCPECGKLLDVTTDFAYGVGPQPSDATFCAYCRALLIFETSMSLRRATEVEAVRFFTENPEVARYDEALRQLHAKRERPRR